jgi:hypothetical protein
MISRGAVRILAVTMCTMLCTILVPRAGHAQSADIRGVIRDSASRTPVPAAVVMTLDAAGESLARTLTTERGAFRLTRTPNAITLRVMRLGFQPVVVPISQARLNDGVLTLDVALTPVARTLQSVDVTAARGCSARADRAEAYALLDGARAGLLAAVIAREKDPPQLHVLRYERRLDVDGIEIVSQNVVLDSSANATTSFIASQSVNDFLARGFRSGTRGAFTYYSPDADVLLDAGFQNGYCFAIAPRDTARRAQVGLHFAPASRRNGRVDIDGTLWIDTTARELREITFRYVGVDGLEESLGAGGRVGFRTLPSGVTFIDRWSLRLVGGADTLETDAGVTVQQYTVREVGGEIADAVWPDGRRWTGALGNVQVMAVSSVGAPVVGANIVLSGTSYRAVSDANGRAMFYHVLPGPYPIAVDDPSLRPLALELNTGRDIVAQRGSTVLARAEIPTPAKIAQRECRRDDLPRLTESWLLGRAIDEAGQPVGDVRWRLLELDNGNWRVRSEGGVTGASGLFALCKGLTRGATIDVIAWRDRGDTARVRQQLGGPLTAIAMRMPTRRMAQRAARPEEMLTVLGTVADSATGTVITDARVSVVGSALEGATDAGGQFIIGGLTRGTYTFEVGTPALDSIGVVARKEVVVREGAAPLALFAPSLGAAISAACGPAGAAGGMVVGRLRRRDANPVIPAGYRVIAEWETDTSTLLEVDSLGQSRLGGWTRTSLEPGGTYRLCGVPLGRKIVVRAESEAMEAGATAPLNLLLAPARRASRADLLLDTALVAMPTFTGTVILDSVGTPVERAEVTLKDIGRSVLTDRRGQFRMADIPPGLHLVSVRSVGYAPVLSSIEFRMNRPVERRVELSKAQALATVSVTAEFIPVEFEERRRIGIGSFLTREQLQKNNGRRLSDVMAQVQGFGSVQGGFGSNAFVVGKRAPTPIVPVAMRFDSEGKRSTCGQAPSNKPGAPGPCGTDMDTLRDKGYYCPTRAEQLSTGLSQCNCFARVYLDDRLMNPGRPTEPFNVNEIPVEQIAGVEWYGSPASTPARYSQLNSVCGVMLIWTRR